MPDMTVFDLHRVRQALREHLGEDDKVTTTACDDVTRHYWALSRNELFVLDGDVVVHRLPLSGVVGSVTDDESGTTLRLRDAQSSSTVIGSFRKPNQLTRALKGIVERSAD
jgi:hypothetical protein